MEEAKTGEELPLAAQLRVTVSWGKILL